MKLYLRTLLFAAVFAAFLILQGCAMRNQCNDHFSCMKLNGGSMSYDWLPTTGVTAP